MTFSLLTIQFSSWPFCLAFCFRQWTPAWTLFVSNKKCSMPCFKFFTPCKKKKVYLQGCRKLASFFIGLCAIAQLWLPLNYSFMPPLFLVVLATFLAIWVVIGWFFASDEIQVCLKNVTQNATTRSISFQQFSFFLVTVLIGGNGECSKPIVLKKGGGIFSFHSTCVTRLIRGAAAGCAYQFWDRQICCRWEIGGSDSQGGGNGRSQSVYFLRGFPRQLPSSL